MNILVTGGAGYIGSHTTVELLQNGYYVIVLDNLVNSSATAIQRVEKITGKSIPLYVADVRDEQMLDKVFEKHNIDAVIHFAGLKAVGESVSKPLEYYDANVVGSLKLIEAMQRHGVKKLIFSSSATVYGSAPYPYEETMQTGVGITNPYGQTKHIVEGIMRDTAASDTDSEFVALRYFNPVGAHESGLIGEDPKGIPNNLMPFVAQVASGKRDKLSIFGNDYDTPDGTCRRDYIHVVDLAKGHLAALQHLKKGFDMINLGSGNSTSVIELVSAFEKSTGQKIAYEFAPRRAGDLPEFYATTKKAERILSWKTKKTIEDMCLDTWRWQSQNPEGFQA